MATKSYDLKLGDCEVKLKQSGKFVGIKPKHGMSNDMTAAVNAIQNGKSPVTHGTFGGFEFVETESEAQDTAETLDHLRNERTVAAGVGVQRKVDHLGQ